MGLGMLVPAVTMTFSTNPDLCTHVSIVLYWGWRETRCFGDRFNTWENGVEENSKEKARVGTKRILAVLSAELENVK